MGSTGVDSSPVEPMEELPSSVQEEQEIASGTGVWYPAMGPYPAQSTELQEEVSAPAPGSTFPQDPRTGSYRSGPPADSGSTFPQDRTGYREEVLREEFLRHKQYSSRRPVDRRGSGPEVDPDQHAAVSPPGDVEGSDPAVRKVLEGREDSVETQQAWGAARAAGAAPEVSAVGVGGPPPVALQTDG